MSADLPTLRARVEAARGQRDRDLAMLRTVPVPLPPDPVTLATDLLALVESQADDLVDLGARVNHLRDTCLLMRESYQHVAQQRDEARAELTAIRAALGNGADEAAWPPGLTVAEAVARLRGARHKTNPAPVCDQVVSVREEDGWIVSRHCPLPAGHEGPHTEALGAGSDGEGDGA